MSAGNNGGQPPDQGDDPFGYLYRPEGGEAGPQQAPRQPSYQQVRPVGERTYGGAQGYRRPDAHYAAPETQPGHGGYPAGPGGGRSGPDTRRNGLLWGAIAVVTVVVLSVGAAILFSSDGGEANANPEPSASADDATDGAGGDEEPSDEPEEDESEDEDDASDELPVGDLTDTGEVTLAGGARLESGVDGSRAEDGLYVGGMNSTGALVTWNFDFQGEPGQYRWWVGYTLPPGDEQALSFAVNSEVRDDKLTMKDYVEADDLPGNWTRTYRLIELREGENTLQLGCDEGDSCDVIIDQLWIGPNEG